MVKLHKLFILIDSEIWVNMVSEATVKDLKEKIFEKADLLSSSKMGLMCVGVKLHDSKKLSEYSIKTGYTIT